MLSINLHASDPTFLSLLGSMYIPFSLCLPLIWIVCEAVPYWCCVSFPAVSVILNLPTIPLFDCFYFPMHAVTVTMRRNGLLASHVYFPMHAVTVTMRRNGLLASHVTLTQEHVIPSYPLASLTTNQCNWCISL